jgi:anti-sigma factor ChrR (cupin superfamily)
MTSVLPSSRLAALGERLALRARDSAAAHRDYHMLRREDRVWIETAPGCERALLWQGPTAVVALWRLAAGAALPWPAGCMAQEILLLEGSVRARAADGSADHVLAPHAYALRGHDRAGTLHALEAQALLYVREMRVEPTRLPEPEGAWWRLKRAPLQLVLPGQRRWVTTFAGVEVLPLWGQPEITSMLVRFGAGASVPDHAHAVHEDCLMLEGEMFLGDLLLRPGDYQLAPAGGSHFGEMSDVGGSFFFHGAIDPVLVPPR